MIDKSNILKGTLMNTKQLIVKCILMYCIISFWEWFLHKEIMHCDSAKLNKVPIMGPFLAEISESHLNHHKAVNIDMTLKGADDVRELFFTWKISIISMILVYFSLRMFKIAQPKNAMILTVLLSVLHSVLWNNWHTRMHAIKPDIPLREGMPYIHDFPQGSLYAYLWKYHAIHHSQKGSKYNYNIIFPLFDDIMKTRAKGFCFDNTEYCKIHDDDRCSQKKKHCYTNDDVLLNH